MFPMSVKAVHALVLSRRGAKLQKICLEVRSLNVTWWPDLFMYGGQKFQVMCTMNVAIVMPNLAALCAAFFTLSGKNIKGGGYTPPPVGAWVNRRTAVFGANLEQLLSQNWYICYLRSGQIRDLFMTSLWEIIEMRHTLSKWVKTTQYFQDYDGLSHPCWFRCHLLTGTPEKVIWGHVRSPVVYC